MLRGCCLSSLPCPAPSKELFSHESNTEAGSLGESELWGRQTKGLDVAVAAVTVPVAAAVNVAPCQLSQPGEGLVNVLLTVTCSLRPTRAQCGPRPEGSLRFGCPSVVML